MLLQRSLLPLLPVLLLLAGQVPLAAARGGMRVDIDEETWPEVLTGGRWFIKFYAPWCDACRSLAPTWQNLAASEDLPRDVSIAQVDVTRNEALAGMFLVTGLPSLYVLHDGQFWQHSGDRSLPALLRYIQQAEYARLPPLPWYRVPTALHMRCLGRLIQAAVRLKKLHTHLVEERGLPSPLAYLVLALATLVSGLVAGLVLVCLCDLLSARRRHRQQEAAAVPGDAKGDSAKVDKPDEASGEDSDELAESPRPATSGQQVRKRGVRKETS
uniref:Thioredoxin domain-containing protein n=2 Tax=Macrostomum lignano TaxID=282301 RepID=A0A1I8GKV9_9PLAT